MKAAPPLDTVQPKVTGSAAIAAKLTATTGAWSGVGNAYNYQWQSGSAGTWSNIPGATSSSYTVAGSIAGHDVRVVVKATNPDGSLSAMSTSTAVVPAAKAKVKATRRS